MSNSYSIGTLIVDVAVGDMSSYAVSKQGTLYAWGERNNQTRPHPVEQLKKEKMVAVASGM